MPASRSDPRQDTPLHRARAELEQQDAQVRHWVENRGEAIMTRPPSGRWSVGEHLAHLALLNGPYLRVMKEAAREGRAAGLEGAGPYRNPLVGRLMIWLMEPPPRLRMRTLKATVPPAEGLTLAEAVRDFDRSQDAFRILLNDAEGLDLGRITVTSPFAGWLTFTLDQAIRLLLAHNRRHLWLADEALKQGAP